jgi:anti-sigma-K factor RskA
VIDHRCSVPEETIVDYAAGKLTGAAAERLRAHSADCLRCRDLLREWSAFPAAADRLASVHAPHRLRGRVMRGVWMRQAFRQWRRFWRGRGWRTVSAASAGLVIVLFVVGLLRMQSGQELVPAIGIKSGPEKTQMLWEPGAAKYTAIADSGGADPVSGEVWLNPRSGEMLLILNGLGPLQELEYQVWGLREDWLHSYGLLTRRDGIGYLYVQEQLPHEPELIIVSVEPKGGSRYPTGPEAIRIGLRR